ncbi:MAG: MATE family efflux transporter [Planctomycetales bacterium]|nr:MATE family efflux transporter [Planctomycetales bacterium]
MHAPVAPQDLHGVGWQRWWRRPAGGRDVFRVAAPLVVSTMSWTALNFIDRVFLKWHSGEAMSAAFGASAMWFAFLCLPLGICAYVNTFVAQYFGDGQPRRIGPAAWQGVYVAIAGVPLLVVAYVAAPQLFAWARHPPEIMDLEIRYFRVLCFGGAGLWVCAALCCVYSGCGRTAVNMWIDAAFAGVNAALDYAWIFGKWGFPAWGIEGAAWATVVSLWLKAAFYVGMMMLPRSRRVFATGQFGLDRQLFKRLLRFGGPSGAQMLLEVAGFTAFVMLTGRLGPRAAEATALAFSVNMLAFMPIWGFAMGACILVGQHLGENRDDLADRSTHTALAMACTYGAIMAVLYLTVPGLFLKPFFNGESAASAAANSEIYGTASRLLWFVAAYTLLDAFQITYVHALKGAGDTRYIMYTSLTMAAFLAISTWLAVTVFHANLYACWFLISAWLAMLAVVYRRRYRAGYWRQMRVIDTVHQA